MDIGFIGLGNMGAHMARRLVEAGHKVFVHDTRQEAIGNLAACGAIAVRSPAEVADAAETVMASLPTPDVVLDVAAGAHGVIEDVRVAFGSVAPVPLRLVKLEAALKGKEIGGELRDMARKLVAAEIAPITDIRSNVEYRVAVAQNLMAEFLEQLASSASRAGCSTTLT